MENTLKAIDTLQYLLAFAVLPSVRIPFADIGDWLQIDAVPKTPFLNAPNVLVEKGWLQQSENTEGSSDVGFWDFRFRTELADI